jgi:REP element-mobilizing transposase RayT
MQKLPALEFGQYYHIYNRGINREDIFFEARNYRYFLDLYAKYVEPIADTFAYCLLRNHFHLLVRIKTAEEQEQTWKVSKTFQVSETFQVSSPTQQFSNFFNAYAKAINKAYHRTGGLFQERFGRIPVTSDEYFACLVMYIHRNPQKHGFVDDFREYPYSSYDAICSVKPTKIKREQVLEWFSGKDWFLRTHQELVDENKIAGLVEGDV